MNLEEKISSLFYEDIIPNASKNGVIIVDEIKYFIHFNTRIENQDINVVDNSIPMLVINDIKEFNKLLVECIKLLIQIFDDRKFDSVKERVCGFEKEDQIKYLLTILFVNCTEEDFLNPISYLQRQIDFIINKELIEKYSTYKEVGNIAELNDSKIEVLSTTQEPTLETPYKFCSRLSKNESGEKQCYDLPSISYGISNGNVYIYTIKGKKRNKEKISNYIKRMNRDLYKVNKGVDPSLDYILYKEGNSTFYPENIIDVTHSSVLALTLFLGILKRENYNRVIIVDYLPIRYLSKYESKLSKLGKCNFSNSKDYSKKLREIEEELDYDQNNITNKFIRTFNRVNYHLENMDIISYPGEIDNFMYVHLNDSIKQGDHIINHLYSEIVESNKKESRK